MSTCKHCNNELTGNYCSNCGRPEKLKRIDGVYIIDEIRSVFNFDKGIFFTIKELLIRPGQSIKTFIAEDRNRLVKPVIFVIVCSLIYTLVIQFLKIENGYVGFEADELPATRFIFGWVQSNTGYSNLIMAIFIAVWIQVFFRKHGYNFFEILILLCFVMGIGMLIFAAFGAIEGITAYKLMKISGIVGVLYCAWAIGHFFGKKKPVNYIKAFLAYMLGMATFMLLAFGLGYLIDSM